MRRSVSAMVGASVVILAMAQGALAEAPANDDRAGAVPITLTTGASSDLAEATTAADDPGPCISGQPEYRSVWFSYTATEAGTTLIGAAAGVSFALHVIAPDGTSELGCATVADPGHLVPHVDIDAVIGETYLVEVAARTDVGTLASVVVERPLAVTMDPVTTGHVTAAGVAGLKLTFHCSQTVIVEPEIDLSQGSGANLAMGSDLRSVNCFAPRTVIPMVVAPGSGPNPDARFRRGQAQAVFQWSAESFIQRTAPVTDRRTVRLTGGPVSTPPPTATTSAPPGAPTDGGLPMVLVSIVTGTMALLLVLRRTRGAAGGRSV